MATHLNKIIKHSFVYGLGNIISKLVGFLMIPLYTHFLSPEDYGVLELLDLTVTLAGLFVGMGISAAIFRFYYEYSDDERNEIISTALIFVFIVSLIVFSILCSNINLISTLVFKSDKYSEYIFWMLVSTFFSILSSVTEAYIQARQNSVLFTTVNLSTLVINLALNIWVVAFLKMGVAGLVYVSAFCRCMNTLTWLVITIPATGLKFSRHKLMQMLSYGIPLLPSNLGLFMIGFVDRFFLSHLESLHSVGLYALGYKFGYMINLLVVQPVNRIWQAQVFEIAEQSNADEVIGKIFTYYSMVVIFAVVGLSVLIKEIIHLVSDPFYIDAYKVVPLIALAGYCRGAYFFFQSGLLIEKKTKYVSYAVGLGVLINLAANYILISRLDFLGAAWSALLTNVAMSFFIYMFAKRVFHVHFEFVRLLHLLTVAVVLYWLSLFVNNDLLWLALSLKTGLILSYPALLWLTAFFTAGEKEQLIVFIKERLSCFKRY